MPAVDPGLVLASADLSLIWLRAVESLANARNVAAVSCSGRIIGVTVAEGDGLVTD